MPIAHISGLGRLGDDSATLADLGFSSSQISTILQAHTSGALSDTGYNQLVSGNVAPSALSDFLGADAGAPTSTPDISMLVIGAFALLLVLTISRSR